MGQPVEKGVVEAVRKAVELYNAYRSPEAHCTLEAFENGKAIARFEGHFCMTCGVFDWVEDFIYVLRDLGVEAAIARIWYRSEEGYVLAEIEIKSYFAETSKPTDAEHR